MNIFPSSGTMPVCCRGERRAYQLKRTKKKNKKKKKKKKKKTNVEIVSVTCTTRLVISGMGSGRTAGRTNWGDSKNRVQLWEMGRMMLMLNGALM